MNSIAALLPGFFPPEWSRQAQIARKPRIRMGPSRLRIKPETMATGTTWMPLPA